MTSNTAYTFASNDLPAKKGKHKRGSNHHHSSSSNGGSDADSVDPTDDSGSLTYSAASSVHSGGSATGESTDSSFADIMRVLDLQDSKELAAFMKKEGVTSANELQAKLKNARHSAASVTSSLNYSTDGESHLDGSQLLQTIAGQPSDSYAFDGGSGGVKHDQGPIAGDNTDILFAPAAPVDSYEKRKRDKKKAKQLQKQQMQQSGGGSRTPRAANHSSNGSSSTSSSTKFHENHDSARSPSSSQHGYDAASMFGNKPPTPPPQPPKGMTEEEEDIWYAKWWMSCFPDSFKNLMPKR